MNTSDNYIIDECVIQMSLSLRSFANYISMPFFVGFALLRFYIWSLSNSIVVISTHLFVSCMLFRISSVLTKIGQIESMKRKRVKTMEHLLECLCHKKRARIHPSSIKRIMIMTQ